MRTMTDAEGRKTMCPLRMAGAAANNSMKSAVGCQGEQCQLWLEVGEAAGKEAARGRCSFVVSAATLSQVPAAIGDSVFNALQSAEAWRRQS